MSAHETLVRFYVVQHVGSKVPLHQMTASAVGNRPEGGMTAPREAAIRSAMHADERLFAFKVTNEMTCVIFC